MGIDYDGGMIVGAEASDIEIPEDYDGEWYDWFEEVGLETMSRWYDSDIEGRVVGFTINSHWSENELDDLVSEVRDRMKQFKELTGVDAKLIGMQNIW